MKHVRQTGCRAGRQQRACVPLRANRHFGHPEGGADCCAGREKAMATYKALVCCRAGVGSSAILETRVKQVVADEGWPIETTHGSVDQIAGFDGDLIITMSDLGLILEDEGKKDLPYVVSVRNIVDAAEIKAGLEGFLKEKGAL